jgi:hypothetical protein
LRYAAVVARRRECQISLDRKVRLAYPNGGVAPSTDMRRFLRVAVVEPPLVRDLLSFVETQRWDWNPYVFSYEAVRDWQSKLASALAANLRRRRMNKVGRSWYADETYIRVRGRWRYTYIYIYAYTYRTIDRDRVAEGPFQLEARYLIGSKLRVSNG